MTWSIEYSKDALDQLKKLDKQTARRILDYMHQRVAASGDPRSTGKLLVGPLAGLWRYRVGDCRVLCELHNSVCRVLVLKIGHRREVYK